MTLSELIEESGLEAGQFVRAVNHIIGGNFNPVRFAEYLKGRRGFSERALHNLHAGAETLVDEVLPLHDAMSMNPAYANMNPLVIAFYNAVLADPQVQADFEWWIEACKANPRLKLISHDILGLTLIQK